METLQTIAAGYGGRLDVVDLGRRRRFSDDFKLAVVEESYAAGAVITQLARRYGVHPSQIYVWRAQARGEGGGVGLISEPAAFVPVVATGDQGGLCEPSSAPVSAPLVIVLSGTRRVEVHPGFDAATLAAVVTTLEDLR